MPDDDQPDLSAFGGRSDSSGGAANDNPDVGDGLETNLGARDDDEATHLADPNGDADDETATEERGHTVAPRNEPGTRPRLTDLDRAERVELGVALLEHLEHESLPLSDAVDRIETITTNPSLTRKILDTAELRGIIDREGGRIRVRRGGTFVRFDESVIRRQGDYECRRCGAGLDTGHFIRFEAGELGPFGPECVRKVLGRS